MFYPKEPLKLSIVARTNRALMPFLRWHVPRAVEISGSPLRSLSIVVAHDPLIKRLHLEYFYDPTITDVITFPLDEDPPGRAITGELYICLSVARQQAHLRGVSVQQELLLYAIHGILHLMGHDDQTPRKYKAMHREEDRILQELGFGPIFDRPEMGKRYKSSVASRPVP